MAIRITTLGGLAAHTEQGEVDGFAGKRLRAAFLVYLAVEERVSRDTLTHFFWPESDEASARHALRQSLYHLRKAFAAEWVDARGDELHVGDAVVADVHGFSAAVARGDWETAVNLYGGPFLEGVQLAETVPWIQWVDARRLQYAREYRRACRERVRAKRSSGDMAGTIEAARRWLAPDPFDDEAQHELIAALALAGRRTDAIRQYDAYVRLLEPEGLEPLEETAALMEGVRSARSAGLGPAREPGAVAEPVSMRPPLGVSTEPSGDPGSARPIDLPGPAAPRRRRIVTAVGAMTLLLAALWALRAPGQGGTLDALFERGASQTDERIVLADFGSPAADPALGAVVSDALRIDLVASQAVQVLERSEVREVLARMQRSGEAVLTPELGREVAVRAGVKAVLEGEIAQAGSGYLLTAVLRAADSGESLAAFRETALGPEEVIPAIDRLSRGIRRQAGESLQELDGSPAMERVTTASLDALRAYTQAVRTWEEDRVQAVALLEEAVTLDPAFGMAWRALGIAIGERDPTRRLEATARAYELRDRMTPRERHLAVAAYHRHVDRDHGAIIESYLRLLEALPNDATALNNLALQYTWVGEYEAAAELRERAAALPDAPASALANLAYLRLAQGLPDRAWQAAAELEQRRPAAPPAALVRFWIHLQGGDAAAARSEMLPLLEASGISSTGRAWIHEHLALAALWEGRLGEARHQVTLAARAARNGGDAQHALAIRLRHAHAEAALGESAPAVRILVETADEGWLEQASPPERIHHTHGTVYGLADRADELVRVLETFETNASPALRRAEETRTEAVRALLHLRRGDADDALRVLEEVRLRHPCRHCLAKRMGRALAEAGRLEEAAAEWEVALAWRDTLFHGFTMQVAQNLWILQHIPHLYEAMGDTARALHHHRRLVEIWADADPELQPRVRQARDRIRVLEAGG